MRETLTLRDTLAEAVARLEAAGAETAALDAQLLLAHALGRNRAYLYAHLDDPVAPRRQEAFLALLRRREAREPLPYLLGAWEFMGMSFLVSPAVLIPRPETEVLVEAVAERVGRSARILDVGAGSGCISAALARLLPAAEILALEPSPPAVAVARANVEALGAGERVRVVEGRFPQDAKALGVFDAVVSNPPYIPSAEVDRLAPELRCYEPRGALDGGPDGLSLLRPLVEESPRLLNRDGLLAVEVARGQAGQVAGLLAAQGAWAEPEIVPDMAGIPRAVLCRLRKPDPL
jgi:release factor glutamine methyltransferase